MKKAQREIVVELNQVSIGASEAIHEIVHNKLSEGMFGILHAQTQLELAYYHLKALQKSQSEGG